MATIKANNPWTWQDALHFGHGVEARGAARVLFCAGQTSVGPDGRLLHSGDMTAQLERAFDNLEAVLTHAGFTLANVVRLNYYVTDMAAFGKARGVIAERLGAMDVKPAGVLLGVSRLADQGALVEIEATAVA